MFDDLAAFFLENVVSFCKKCPDIKSALNAAIVLFHLRELLPPNKALFCTEVEKCCAN